MDEIKTTKIKQPIGQPDSFLRTAVKIGGSIMISIPKELIEYNDVREGDLLRVWFKKVYEK